MGQRAKADGIASEVAKVTMASSVQRVNLKRFNTRSDKAYEIPQLRNDGILVDDMSNVKVDADLMSSLIKLIEANNLTWFKDSSRHSTNKGCVDSFLLLKDGKLVVEEYFADSRWDKPHFQMSITKSITALALGIVIEQGNVKSEQDKILDYLPEVNVGKVPELLKEIKISDVLSMQSGIRLSKDYQLKTNVKVEDCMPNIFEHCQMLEPGATYKYQGVDPEIISHIIYNTTGLSVEALVAEHLFKPMAINSYSFQSSPCGLTKTAAGMALSSRDMLKVGQLALDKGKWRGQQIISSDWMEKVNTSAIDNGKHQYGYFWWQHQVSINKKKIEIKSCRGALGQFIYVIPELNCVAVFTSYGTRAPFKYLEEYIVPALM